MSDQFPIDAISDITDPTKVRVVLFINNRLVHVPLLALLKDVQQQIDAIEAEIADLDARVTALEP